MIFKSIALSAVGLAMSAMPALAGNMDPIVVYPYATSANYCPAGLQPVTTNGIICCGTPSTNISYQAAKGAPVARKTYRAKSRVMRARVVCPVGEKGCYSQ
jgi:hypothetical protein